MSGSNPARIGLIGASWRGQYYLRIAQQRPDLFSIARVLTRTPESAERIGASYAVPAGTDLDAFLRAGGYDYVVVSVPRDQCPELIKTVVAHGVPVLAETPPATDLAGLVDLYRHLGPDAPVQVAEQYRFQPHHRARLAAAHSGLLGQVTWTRMSIAHGYHGISMIRTALGLGFEPVTITAETTVDHLLHARGRDEWSDEFTAQDSIWTRARLASADKVGIYEFNGEQYVSPIRSRHLVIRGERGEIVNDDVAYLVEPGHAVKTRLVREETGLDGDLEGSFLRSLSLGDRVLYRNAFAPARLSDDDLAVAECMARMHSFVQGGDPYYGLADACHDHYLSLLVDEAAKTGKPVASEPQPWSDASSLIAGAGQVNRTLTVPSAGPALEPRRTRRSPQS